MRISDMARMDNFDINKLLGGKSSHVKKSTASNPKPVQFKQPNWDMVPTKGKTKRSQEEIEQAIIDLATKEAEAGILAGTGAQNALMLEYMSLVSPDRKAAFAKYDGISGAVTGAELNAFGGNELMTYSSVDRSWATVPTKAERDMMYKFFDIYRNAYQAYEAEHGTVVGIPTVTSPKMNFFA